jgi:hypothetical protein
MYSSIPGGWFAPTMRRRRRKVVQFRTQSQGGQHFKELLLSSEVLKTMENLPSITVTWGWMSPSGSWWPWTRLGAAANSQASPTTRAHRTTKGLKPFIPLSFMLMREVHIFNPAPAQIQIAGLRGLVESLHVAGGVSRWGLGWGRRERTERTKRTEESEPGGG